MSGALARDLGAVLLTSLAMMPASGETAMTLEAIVKFSSTSSMGREIGRMLDEGSSALERLSEPIDSLEGTIGIPLEARGITSGRELVVGIREDAWLGAVERACREQEAVATAALVDVRSDSSLLATHRVEVRLAASTPERRVIAAAYPEAPRSDRVQALAEALAAPSGVPVDGAALAEDRLGLTIARRAAVTMLLERLRASDSVEYAQANVLLRPQ